MGRAPKTTAVIENDPAAEGGFERQAAPAPANVPATRQPRGQAASRLAPMGHNGPPTPADMLMEMIRQGASMEVIERGQALMERWEKNEARKAFNNAVANVKPKLPTITRNRHVGYESKRPDVKNGKVDYTHEDMAQIAEAINPVLATEGLGFRYRAAQDPQAVMIDGRPHHKLTVTCVLFHRDGHEEEVPLFAYPDTSGGKNGIQGIGSAATYLERYTVKLALGLAVGDDDDGEGTEERSSVPSAGAAQKQAPPQQQQTQTPQYVAEGQIAPKPLRAKDGPAWTDLYIKNMQTAGSIAVIEEWDAINDKTLKQIEANFPDLHERINEATRQHKLKLVRGNAPPPPAQPKTEAAPSKPAAEPRTDNYPGLPDPEADYEGFIEAATLAIREWKDPDTLHGFWNERIEGANIMQPDKEDLLSALRAAERRMEG